MVLDLFLVGIALTTTLATAWPLGPWAGDPALGLDFASDLYDNYYGPWSNEYLRGNRWWGSPFGRGSWPNGYGPGDAWDSPWNYGADYYYGGYPRTDVAKEKYVRDSPFGETEVGVRDSMSVRSPPGGPWGRWSGSYVPPYRGLRSPNFYDYDWPYFRRPYQGGLGFPRPSSLRNGGDLTFLRR